VPRYNVEYNGVTTIRREFPDEIGDVKAANLTIYNREGSALATVAQVITPTACTAAVDTGVGSTNTDGAHIVKIAYVTSNGTTQMGAASNTVTVSGGDNINLTSVPVSVDTMVTARNVYMTKAAGSTYYYVGQIANNTATTYTIAIADASLTVEGPSVNTSATTIPQIGAPTTYTYEAVLTSATKVGENTATFDATPDTFVAGDVYRIGGTSSTEDTLRVESYNSTTRVVTFSDYFRHAHAAGEYAKARFCTYLLSTTTVATWTSGLDLTFVWTFYSDGAGTASPYMPYTDEGRVLKRISGEGGLEAAFRMRYRQYAEMVADVDYTVLSADAENELTDLFSSRGLDVQKVVDSHAFYELRLCQMAYSIAFGLGSEWDSQRAALTTRRLELINLLSSMPVWSDTDQALTEEDEEVQTYDRPQGRRRIF